MSRLCNICGKNVSEYNDLGYCYHHGVQDDFDITKWQISVLHDVLLEIRFRNPVLKITHEDGERTNDVELPNALLETAVALTGHEFDIDPDVLFVNTRKSEIARVRQVAMYVMREEGCSFPAIGAFFEKDHTTVMHACEKIQSLCENDAELRGKIERIRSYLTKK